MFLLLRTCLCVLPFKAQWSFYGPPRLKFSPGSEFMCCIRFLGAFAKFRKATISYVMSVCPSVRPSVRMEEFGSHCTYFREIRLPLRIFVKFGSHCTYFREIRLPLYVFSWNSAPTTYFREIRLPLYVFSWNSAPTVRIFVRYYIWGFLKHLSR
jgi:hypothetical protein